MSYEFVPAGAGAVDDRPSVLAPPAPAADYGPPPGTDPLPGTAATDFGIVRLSQANHQSFSHAPPSAHTDMPPPPPADAGRISSAQPVQLGTHIPDTSNDAQLALALSAPVGPNAGGGGSGGADAFASEALPSSQVGVHLYELKDTTEHKEIRRLGTKRKNAFNEVQEENPPYFSVICAIVCGVMFIYEMYKAGWSFAPPSQNPLIGPPAQVLVDIGAKDTAKIVDGEYWRLVVPIFMHGGIVHYIMNMSVLLRLGKDLELDFGTWRVTVIFMVCGIFGNVCSALFLTNSPAVGASGALYGYIGALFGEFFQNHDQILDKKEKYKTFASLLVSTLLGLAFGLLPLLDNFQHLGGCIMGVFLGGIFLGKTVLDPKTKKPVHSINRWLQLVFTGIALCMFFAFVLALFVGTDGNDVCGWCHYLSCVETPWWSCDPQLQSCGNLVSYRPGALPNCTHAEWQCFTGSQPNNTWVCA